MKKLIIGFVITVSILFVQSSSFAQSSPIFGPKKYTREKGKPEKTKEIFHVCAVSGVYKLIVDNGVYTITEDEKGKDKKDYGGKKDKEDKEEKKTKVSAAEIEINGEEAIEEDDFNKKVARIERSILLPQGENQMEIEVEGEPGAYITVTIECASGCLQPKITSPVTGSAINKSKTIIQGSLSNLYGEAGVILRSSGAVGEASMLSQLYGNSFAGTVPLQQGQNTITATATDACGYQAHDTITINSESVQEPIRLTANPQSGIPNATGTFSTTLEADASLPNPVSSYSWDTDGDGTAEQTGKDFSKITAAYQAPGLYFPKVTITDSQNNVYTETTIVNVFSKDVMDAIFKGKWEGMKGALVSGNKDKALQYFSEGSKGKYGEIFNVLNDLLPTSVVEMGEIQFLYLKDKTAKYRVRRNQVIDSRQELVTYYIYFSVDDNGLWKIVSF